MALPNVVRGNAALLCRSRVVVLRALAKDPLLGVETGRLAVAVDYPLHPIGASDNRHEERLRASQQQLEISMAGDDTAWVVGIL